MIHGICRNCLAILAGLFLVFGAATSRATVVVVADYNLGENDPGAAAGNPGNSATVDSSGNAFDLTTRIGSPTYSADHAPGIGSLSMAFAGGSFYRGPTVTDDTENFGIEAYVRPSSTSGVQAIAINGSGCCSGFGLYLQDGFYYWLYGGVNTAVIGAAVPDTWAYIALVNDGGMTTAYLNLTAIPVGFAGDPHPATGPVCCAPPLNMTIGSDGSNNFNGLIDEVRVFTFAPGQFRQSDLEFVPEPASLALFGLGLGGLGFARRRKI